MQEPFHREVLESFDKGYDLQVNVCKLTVGDVYYLDIREYIPSLDRYGRGVTASEGFKDKLLWGLAKW
jgi:hypothetical protein